MIIFVIDCVDEWINSVCGLVKKIFNKLNYFMDRVFFIISINQELKYVYWELKKSENYNYCDKYFKYFFI